MCVCSNASTRGIAQVFAQPKLNGRVCSGRPRAIDLNAGTDAIAVTYAPGVGHAC